MKKNIIYIFISFILIVSGCVQNNTNTSQSGFDELLTNFHQTDSALVLVAAHRAAHNKYPENSLPAIQEAIDLGTDIIEIDVKVTTDSIAYLMHDRTINRTTTGVGHCDSVSFAEVKQVFLLKGDSVTSEKVPTLEEALKIAKGKILVDLDLKTDNLKPIIEAVVNTGTQKQVFFFDSDYEVLRKVKQFNNAFMLMPRAHNYAMADSAIKLFAPEVVHIDFSFYEPEVVSLIKKNNARIWINALGKPDDLISQGEIDAAIDSLTVYGANIIQTDYPGVLVSELEKRDLR